METTTKHGERHSSLCCFIDEHCRTTAINQNACPRVLFMDMKVDFKKQLDLGFEHYCEVYDGTHNTSKSRTQPCIAIYPCCNFTGSGEFMSLTTKKRIHYLQWQCMVTTEVIINATNAFDEERQEMLQDLWYQQSK
jgi:hypothetical protein